MSESLVRLTRQIEKGCSRVTLKKRLHGLKFFRSIKGRELVLCVLKVQLARTDEQARGTRHESISSPSEADI